MISNAVFDGLLGLLGVIFMIFVVLDISSILSTRMELIHKIYIFFRVRNHLKEMIPPWWEIRKISLFTIQYNPSKDYVQPISSVVPGVRVYVEVSCKIKSSGTYTTDGYTWTNDFIVLNRRGRPLNTRLLENISNHEMIYKINDGEKKKFSRDRVLEELGI